MRILKLDFKQFTKPMVVYIALVQVLIALAALAVHNFINTENVVLGYFTLFTVVVSIVAVIMYTILFIVYYVIKSNSVHKQAKFELTDGYGLYRFVTSLLFLGVIALNGIVAIFLQGIDVRKLLTVIPHYDLAAGAFILIPMLVLVILSLGYAHEVKLLRNIEVILSIIGIIIGLYVAGNLYYFSNGKQATAVFFIIFLLIAILYASIKTRDSEPKTYKIIIILLSVVSIGLSGYLMATSNFSYITRQESKNSERQAYETKDTDVEIKTIKTSHGDMKSITNDDGSQLYSLTTKKYTYRIAVAQSGEIDANIYKLDSADEINVYSSDDQATLTTSDYDSKTHKKTECSMDLNDIDGDKQCSLDSEITDVYKDMKDSIE